MAVLSTLLCAEFKAFFRTFIDRQVSSLHCLFIAVPNGRNELFRRDLLENIL